MSRSDLPIDDNPSHLLRLLALHANEASALINLRIDDKFVGFFYDDCADALENKDPRAFLRKWRHAYSSLLYMERVARDLGELTDRIRHLHRQLNICDLLDLPPSPPEKKDGAA